MNKAERHTALLRLVAEFGQVRITDIAPQFDASLVTLRRDMRELAADGRVSYVQGVARVRRQQTREPTFAEKSRVSEKHKLEIARTAAALVHDGDSVVLGAGTTTAVLAQQLKHKDIEVWTNSLAVASVLAESGRATVYVSGGELRGSTHALIGSRAERFFTGLRASFAFLSANGFTPERGLTTPNARVAEVDRAIVQAAERIVALVDHTKIGVSATLTTAPLSRIARLVTDRNANSDVIREAQIRGLAVDIAPTLTRR